MRFFFPAFVVATATSVNAITLLQVLQSYPQLSTLSAYVNASSASTALLSTANNFTFLAPSNAAIAKYLVQNPNVLTPDLLAATLQYSLLKGGYPSLSFTNTPVFADTYLSNATYANVTGGQKMELLSASDGTAQMWSGNKTISSSATADIVCTGGIIHILDTVPQIPLTAVSEITAANMKYFVSILSTGNYLNSANVYVNSILEIPDVTYFIPNSEQALAAVSAMVKNGSATPEVLKESFEYHVVSGSAVYGSSLVDGVMLKTMQGGELRVSVVGGQVWVNGARVVGGDYLVANGVVHVIDSLLNPNNTSGPPPQPTSTTPTTTSSTPLSSPTTSPLPFPKTLDTAPETTHSLSTKSAIAIAVSISASILLLIAAITFFLVRRSKNRAHSHPQGQNQQGLARMGSNSSGLSPSSSLRSSKFGKGERKDGFVHREREVEVEVRGGSWGSRGGEMEGMEMGGVGEVGFQSMRVEDRGVGGVNGIGNVNVNASTECVAGPPYIPPRSPERGFVSLRREFF